MKERDYIGHPSQLWGVEESRLAGGRGDGMRLLAVRSGGGLEFTVSADRCADISRLSWRGYNFGFFAPCGYVGPQYYDAAGDGFLKSFTAGFMTTCGLTAVGSPCVDEGETLPMHGTISNTPAEQLRHWTDDTGIHIEAVMRDARLFGRNLTLTRHIFCPAGQNRIEICDTVANEGTAASPLMLLYHCNMGYPLLSERARLYIPSETVTPRDERAAEGVEAWMDMLPPQEAFAEQVYYHDLRADTGGRTGVALYNPDIRVGVALRFDKAELDRFIEWKMMGKGEYVLGLEPGTCHVEGRSVERQRGGLKWIEPGEKKQFHLEIAVLEDEQTAQNFEK